MILPDPHRRQCPDCGHFRTHAPTCRGINLSREDHFTSTEADAGTYDRQHFAEPDDRPTRAELDREEAEARGER